MSPSATRAPVRAGSRTRAEQRAPVIGLVVALILPVLGLLVPLVTGLGVASRAPRNAAPRSAPPLHGFLEVTWFGPGTVPALLIALLGWRYAADVAQRLAWRRLLAVSFVASLAWLLALALVTGTDGIGGILRGATEYLPTVHQVGHSPGDVHRLLETYVERISYDVYPHNWPTQVAGHPPGMLLVFVLLAAVGLGGDLATGLAVIAVAATIAVAVLVTLRALGAEAQARRAAPFLVLTPSAVFLAVSGDAVISAVVAWGLACLALGATAASRRWRWGWSALAGLLLGYSVLMSYGMPLMGLVALAVLVAASRPRSSWRSVPWQPLPIAAAAAVVVVLVFAALGFAWWEAYPVLHERYNAGIAKDRPYLYWVWANFGALAVSAGPLLGAGLASAGVAGVAALRDRRAAVREPGPVPDGDPGRRVVLLLVAAAVLVTMVADLSGMSKAEVERIWLPFIPWLTLSCALLPDRWRRPGLAVQLLTALLVEHLLHTSW